jgi:hypothetical protein
MCMSSISDRELSECLLVAAKIQAGWGGERSRFAGMGKVRECGEVRETIW